MSRLAHNLGLVAVAAAVVGLAGCGSTVEMGADGTGVVATQGLGGPTVSQPQTAPSSGGSAGVGDVTVPQGATSSRTGHSVTAGIGATTPVGPSKPGGKSSGGAASVPTRVQTGPLTVGFLTTGTSNAQSTDASLGNTVSESGVDQALIAAMNKHGGIDGRPVKIVLAHTDTGSSNWANDFQAACATFTQDNHVDVVLGYQFTYEPNLEQCLAKHGIPHLSDGFNVPSNSVLAQYPLFWSLDVPTIGERSIAKFQGAINTGFLTARNKLGIVLDDCPGTLDAWKSQVRPFLVSHHIDVAMTDTTSCGTGNNSGTTSTVSAITSALVKFRSQGVDRISFVSVSEAPALYVISVEAQSQGYYPGWIVSSLGQLAIIGGEAPQSEMRNTHGYGWMPSQDVPPQYNPKANASQRRCYALLRSQGVKPRSAADFGYAYNACEAVFLYERALKLDGGSSNGVAVSAAIASLGHSFESTLNLYGRTTFSNAARNNAPAVYKPINWDGNCHCFRYGHQTYPMP
ncbi:MAG TPA: hypothetical protein VHC43_10620 [Mycobacteriales bacterium]|nr:hypothetical protein [Mycobacteriales bacterium]